MTLPALLSVQIPETQVLVVVDVVPEDPSGEGDMLLPSEAIQMIRASIVLRRRVALAVSWRRSVRRRWFPIAAHGLELFGAWGRGHDAGIGEPRIEFGDFLLSS